MNNMNLSVMGGLLQCPLTCEPFDVLTLWLHPHTL